MTVLCWLFTDKSPRNSDMISEAILHFLKDLKPRLGAMRDKVVVDTLYRRAIDAEFSEAT